MSLFQLANGFVDVEEVGNDTWTVAIRVKV